MPLADALGSLSPNRPGEPCRTCALLGSLDEADADALRAVLNVPRGHPDRIGAEQLHRVLGGEGISLSRGSIERHRREQHG